MKEQSRNGGSAEKRILILLFAAALLRIGFSVASGIWFPPVESCDDVLMLEYASLRHHFTEPNLYSLAKYLSYPLFLAGVRVSHLPYAVVTGILWSAAAFFTRHLFRELTRQKYVPEFLFFYVLFLPAGFETSAGLRMYRNGILAPFTILTLGLILLCMKRVFLPAERKRGAEKHLLLPAVLGAVFTFTYYVKEDGIWFLAVLLFSDVLLGVNLLVSHLKKQGQGSVPVRAALRTALLPILVFAAVTGASLLIHHHFFGVYELNTRTGGETGAFVQKVYAIRSDADSDTVWSPLDAIDRAFEASETLKSREGLYDALMRNPWSSGDLSANALQGDYLTWALRYALNEASGGVYDEAGNEAFFRRVNAELDQAFRDGRLPKTDRIRLLPSAGSKSPSDVLGILSLTWEGLKGGVWLSGYAAGIHPGAAAQTALPGYEGVLRDAAAFANTPYLVDYEQGKGVREAAAAAASVLMAVDRVVNVILLGASILSLIAAAVRLFRGRRGGQAAPGDIPAAKVPYGLCTLFFLGLGALYTFSICWFSSFLHADGVRMEIMNFYTVSLPAILVFAYGCGLSGLFKTLFSGGKVRGDVL
ncbi:MAG: hypothetical protein J6U26_06270 [Lachnospiraceae bacterium]|nr:hypothetical protein [Lachnospiraceae bacterium]